MQRLAFFEGAFLPMEQVRVSADDRGYYFGDGVYEVVMGFRGQPFGLAAHLRRWAYSVGELRLRSPYTTEEIEKIIREALLRVPAPQVLVYFQLTRGVFPRVHSFPPADVPGTFLLTAQPFADDMIGREEGMRGHLTEDIRWRRCDIKSLNLLPNTLATQEALDAGAQAPIFVRDGIVTECGSANLFIVKDGKLRTHPLGHAILPGTTRADILRLAGTLGIPCEETPFGVDALESAEEVFCTSVATRPHGIVEIDGRPVGDGQPGPITLSLQRAYDDLVLSECP